MKRFLLLCLLLLPSVAFAHGGEDHGHEESSHAASPSEHVASAETELFTVVLKFPARGRPGTPLPARIYVADFATGAPVDGATLRMELRGIIDTRPTPRSGEPGVYECSFPEPAAGRETEALVTVTARSGTDLIPVAGVHFGPPPAPTTTNNEALSNRFRALLAAGAIGALSFLCFGLLAWVAQRKTTEVPS